MNPAPARIARGDRLSDDAMCVMQAVAYAAGEPRTDHPKCCSSLITEFAISLNDAIDDDSQRTDLLRPLVPLLVGTRVNDAADLSRSYMALDWLAREYVPAWLDLVPVLQPLAAELRALPPIHGPQGFDPTVRALLSRAREAARNAALQTVRETEWDEVRDAAASAARDAARTAAWDAARDAAGDAVRDAAKWSGQPAGWVAAWAAAEQAVQRAEARHARMNAWAAARDTAGDAAWAAARDAAGDAIRAVVRDAAGDAAWAAAGRAANDAATRVVVPTVRALQASAADLLRRMCVLIYFADRASTPPRR